MDDIYGRFDFSFGEDGEYKLLEFNADTPTTLVEASVVQWFWFQEKFGNNENVCIINFHFLWLIVTCYQYDQFNSIHQNLIDQWKVVAKRFPEQSKFHLSCVKDHEEDFRTINYLLDVAVQAGVDASSLFIDDVGWNKEKECFVDLKVLLFLFLFNYYINYSINEGRANKSSF